jgi:hypothetical protein
MVGLACRAWLYLRKLKLCYRGNQPSRPEVRRWRRFPVDPPVHIEVEFQTPSKVLVTGIVRQLHRSLFRSGIPHPAFVPTQRPCVVTESNSQPMKTHCSRLSPLNGSYPRQ